jgi:hypothetical protein
MIQVVLARASQPGSKIKSLPLHLVKYFEFTGLVKNVAFSFVFMRVIDLRNSMLFVWKPLSPTVITLMFFPLLSSAASNHHWSSPLNQLFVLCRSLASSYVGLQDGQPAFICPAPRDYFSADTGCSIGDHHLTCESGGFAA